MTEKELEKREKREVSHTGAEQMVDTGSAYSPDVDIYLSDEALLLVADLPGVEKGDVNIEIDENNSLVIKAKTTLKETEKPIFKQFNIGNYYRAFQIGDEFDKDKVAGQLENGLLEVRIPKREEAKPKRIAINA